MSFLPRWPPDLSQSGVLSWPSLVARVFQVLEWLQLSSVPSVGSTALLRGSFRYLWSSWLCSSFPGSLVFQLHGFLHRSLSQLSTTQILQLLLLDLDICRQINATSMCLWVLPLLLGKFMPLSNTSSWISVLRTIAYLDQLSASEDVLILFHCHLANALQHSFIKLYLSEIWTPCVAGYQTSPRL